MEEAEIIIGSLLSFNWLVVASFKRLRSQSPSKLNRTYDKEKRTDWIEAFFWKFQPKQLRNSVKHFCFVTNCFYLMLTLLSRWPGVHWTKSFCIAATLLTALLLKITFVSSMTAKSLEHTTYPSLVTSVSQGVCICIYIQVSNTYKE